MATVNKDFKIKSGLIVEGTTATVNGFDVLTKKTADQTYIVNLIGGTATSANEANKVVKRDANGDFAAGTITANVTGNLTGNADTATALETSRTIELTGDVTGSVSFDGTANVQISTTLGGSFATDAEVSTAKSEAITAAEEYTDGRETAITTAYQSYADTAEADAISAAAADATTKADAALASANSYTDDEIGSLDLSLKAYADQAETDAIATASADATSKANAAQAAAEATASADATSKANAAQAAAELTASNANSSLYTTVTGDIATAKSEAILSANAYTDAEVAALVGQAPELLDTLNELAAAIADNPNYATDVANLVATKADTAYGEISDLDTAAQGYASAAQTAAEATASADATSKANAAQAAAEATAALDATSKANAAESDANIYTDGKITQEVADRNSAISSAIDTEVTNRNSAINAAIGQEVIDRNSAITTAVDALSTTDIEEGTNLYFTNQRAIDAVGGTIGDAIDELDTDDIEEGSTNLYFTDSRAKTSAAQLLTGAALTNITITGTGAGLTITAENGVADSDTDDLVEGTTNKYFTDARARTAVDGTDRSFTSVELNSVAKQVAATLSAPTAGIQVAHAFAKADYRSAEYLVKVAYGTHTEISKVLLTLDSSDNIAITEYGIVGTNGSASSISAGISGENVQLQVTTANNDSTVTVMGTLLV
jgi:hypothetical protein